MTHSLESLRGLRDHLNEALDAIEAADPGGYTSNFQLRQTGFSLHLKWKPKFPLASNLSNEKIDGPTTMLLRNVCDPALFLSILSQLVDLLEHEVAKSEAAVPS